MCADVDIVYQSNVIKKPVRIMVSSKVTSTVNLIDKGIVSIDLYQFQRVSHLLAIKLSRNPLQELDVSPLFFCRNRIIIELDNKVRVFSGVELYNHPNRPVGRHGKPLQIEWKSEHLSELFQRLNPLSLLNQSRFFRSSGQQLLAEESLEHAITKAKGDYEQSMQIADSLRNSSELKHEERVLNHAVQAAKPDFRFLLELGDQLSLSGHRSQAYMAYARALKTESSNPFQWLELCRRFHTIDDIDLCCSACKKAITYYNAQSVKAFISFGKRIENLDCQDVSKIAYKKALLSAQGTYEDWMDLGELLNSRKYSNIAFRRVIDFAPKKLSILVSIGNRFVALNKKRHAEEAFARAFSLMCDVSKRKRASGRISSTRTRRIVKELPVQNQEACIDYVYYLYKKNHLEEAKELCIELNKKWPGLSRLKNLLDKILRKLKSIRKTSKKKTNEMAEKRTRIADEKLDSKLKLERESDEPSDLIATVSEISDGKTEPTTGTTAPSKLTIIKKKSNVESVTIREKTQETTTSEKKESIITTTPPPKSTKVKPPKKRISTQKLTKAFHEWLQDKGIFSELEEDWDQFMEDLVDIEPRKSRGGYQKTIETLRQWYNGCQICGIQTPRTSDKYPEVQETIASIILSSGGLIVGKTEEYSSGNSMYLCPRHHYLMKRGLIRLDELNERIDEYSQIDHEAISAYLDSLMEKIAGPQRIDCSVFENEKSTASFAFRPHTISFTRNHYNSLLKLLKEYLTE